MAGNVARSLYKVYVGNLPWTVGHFELKNYFNKYGQVAVANVIFDRDTGLSRNYGFVFYRNKDEFDKAINTEGHKLEGNTLKVFPANQTQPEQ
ncbi:31 kDa ribonucleoprotein, chloroplastic-like [Tribolium madens]|uniref:31 kDa ribonucleoprotein, chloroplastic-like n=1 Tax=Tribolium madens TaxID=41895 RepID=UPI001CF75171|nr:31 kDa ribonucleoprotein, chloroplastic-like [Tribolium madens]